MSCVLAINYLCVCVRGRGRQREKWYSFARRTNNRRKKKLHGIKSDTGHAFIGPFPLPSPFQSLRHYRHTLCTKLRTKHTPPFLPENAPHAPIFSNERTNYKRKFLNLIEGEKEKEKEKNEILFNSETMEQKNKLREVSNCYLLITIITFTTKKLDFFYSLSLSLTLYIVHTQNFFSLFPFPFPFPKHIFVCSFFLSFFFDFVYFSNKKIHMV